MNTTDKLAEALRLAREWFRHEEAGEGPQAYDVIKAADEAIAAYEAEQAAKAVPADLRSAAERTRQDLGPTGSNYPDVRVLLAFVEQALAAPTPPAPEADELAAMLRGLGFEGQCPDSIGMTLRRWMDGYAKWLGAVPATPAQMVSEDFQCADHDSPWLICKTCAADGKCARATPSPAPAEQAQAGDRAMASDWSWTGVRMELEASGRDDLSAWVSQQIEPKAHAGEPVVPYLYVYEYDSPFGLNREFYPSGWNGQKPTRTVPLYTTPQPAQAERVGLTDEQIAEGRYRTWAAEPEDAPEAWSFLRGARWAESALAVRWGVKLGATTGEQR